MTEPDAPTVEQLARTLEARVANRCLDISESRVSEHFIAVVESLGRSGDPRAIDPLIGALARIRDSYWSDISEAAAKALATLRDKRGTIPLLKALAGEGLSAESTESLAAALVSIQPQWSDYLKLDERYRFDLAGLGSSHDPEAVEAIVQVFVDLECGTQYRLDGVRGLILSGGAGVAEMIWHALDGEYPVGSEYRSLVIGFLDELSALLTDASSATDARVREAASLDLQRLAAIPPMAQKLKQVEQDRQDKHSKEMRQCSARRELEGKMKERRAKKLCITCGKNPGLLDSWRGKERCDSCAQSLAEVLRKVETNIHMRAIHSGYQHLAEVLQMATPSEVDSYCAALWQHVEALLRDKSHLTYDDLITLFGRQEQRDGILHGGSPGGIIADNCALAPPPVEVLNAADVAVSWWGNLRYPSGDDFIHWGQNDEVHRTKIEGTIEALRNRCAQQRPQRIQFRCPQCDKSVVVARQHAGKQGKCPGCGAVISIPREHEGGQH